jgi:Tfp pilus assembly protein PilF
LPKVSNKQKITLIICGVLFSFVILEIGLRIGGFIFLSLQERKNQIFIKQPGIYRIICLGESTTAGTEDSYPFQLEKILNQLNTRIKFSVINKGVPATDTKSILKKLEENINKYRPDMVITMMGINDSMDLPAKQQLPITIALKNFRTYKLIRLLWQRVFAKINEISDYGACVKSGWDYLKQEKYYRAEQLFKKAVAMNPKNEWAYIGLRWSYLWLKKYSQIEGVFKKAIKINPGNEEVYKGMRYCWDKEESLSVEILLRQAIELNASSYAYVELGYIYKKHGKDSQAEGMFKKALTLNPENFDACIELGLIYISQRKYSEAEELYRNFISINPDNDKAYGSLIALYEIMGKIELAREYTEKVNKLRQKYYNSETIHNYQNIREILEEKGIKFVCMQYPMRSIKPLKAIFTGKENVIFVDNESVFKEALNKGSYKEYFNDMFGGDFGHCTPKGNNLIAENIANAILKEIPLKNN